VPDTRAVGDAHALTAETAARALETDARAGLSTGEAERRLAAVGPNELDASPPPSLPALIFDAASEPFVLLLLVAGLAAVALGEVRDGLLVLVGLIPIVGADVVTEYRADRALEELRAAAAAVARVRRDGLAVDVPAAELVPGDVVLVRAGDIVPADLRLTAVNALSIDRAILTGESGPEVAATHPDDPDSPIVDRHSIAYSGTSVVHGSGEGIVVATAGTTEAGRIAGSLGPAGRRRSPLQRELDRLVRILLVVAIGLIGVTVGSGFLRGNPAGANLLAGISAAIAAIPEEPPVLLAVILGLGAHRLLRRGVLVRRLSAEETLGSVGLILTDKTGTLTENRQVLVGLVVDPDGGPTDDPAVRLEIAGAALRAEEDAWRTSSSGGMTGSFTRALEDAILELGGSTHLDPADLLAGEPPIEGRPYGWTRSRRAGRIETLALGAPEAVLELSRDPAEAERTAWLRAVDEHAAAGRRLLLLASRSGGDAGPWQPMALLLFADPLRPGVREALRTAREAGIQTVMVTGDHRATAMAVAAAAGLGAERIVDGEELGRWDDARLDRELADLHGVARARPSDKVRLVDAARRTGRTVAVTGDGVNDAPALQRADVAVAMGSGTAVAKGAADLVLGDDSFSTLLYAVGDGRRIVANVRKGLIFLISTHVALLGFVLIATLAGWSQPLLPIQILWLELFIDLSTSVAFEREPAEPDAMQVPPRDRDEPLLPAWLLTRIAAAGGFSAVAALALMTWQPGGFDHARWLAFTALVVGQAVRAYANRSLTAPFGALPRNGVLAVACLAVIAIQALIPWVPPLAEAFRASPLDGLDWLLVAIVALGPAAVADLVRRLTGRPWVA
jgi:Ca2+-transporting ATPase